MQQNFHDNSVTKPIRNFLTALNLRLSGHKKFYQLVMGEYTSDKTSRRMAVALKAMKKRYPRREPTVEMTWALSEAAAKDNLPMMEFLLAMGARIDGASRYIRPEMNAPQLLSPILSAIAAGKEEAVSYLLSKRAKPEPSPETGVSAFLPVAARINPKLVPILLDAGARKGADEALYELIANKRDIETADDLIRKTGTSVNALDGKIVQTVVGDYGHRPRPYFIGTFLPEQNQKALEYLAGAGADFNAAAQKFRKEYTDDVPHLASLAEQWARKQPFVNPFVPARKPVTAPKPAPAVGMITAAFGKGSGSEIVAPEKATFKKRPRLAQGG